MTDKKWLTEKFLRKTLIVLWLAYLPTMFIALTAVWGTHGAEKHNQVAFAAMVIAVLLAPILSKIIGLIAIARKRKGLAWQDQSPLLQATAIFTVSFIVNMTIVYAVLASSSVFSGGDDLPLPRPYKLDLLPLEWLVNTFVYIALASVVAPFLIMTAPQTLILFILLIRNKQISKYTFYTLAFISTLGWLGISCVGLIVSAV